MRLLSLLLRRASNVKLANGRHLLLVSYEAMLQDLDRVVKTLVEFLNLDVSDDQQAHLLPKFSFNSMKADIDRFRPKSVHWKNNFCFLRKGVAGDSAEIITNAQRARFLDRLEQSGLLKGNTLFHQRLREITQHSGTE
jgi:Sulfotransferase domain